MKKRTLFNFFLVCIMAFSFVACSDNDDPEPKENTVIDLPHDAQLFLSHYLPDFTEKPKVDLSDKGIYTVYYMQQDLSVDFDKDGKWILAESTEELPQSLLNCLPANIKDATEAFHENDIVKGIQVKEYGYMIKVPEVQLAYNKDGKYLGYDEVAKADKLSKTSLDFIKQYWKDAEVTSVIFNAEDYSKRYHLVYLSDETIIRFDYTKCIWQKIDGGTEPLSKDVLALMPADIVKGAEEVGKNSSIISMEIEQVGLYNFRFANGNGYTLITEDYKGEPATSGEIYTAVTEFIKLHWSKEEDVRIRSFSWGTGSSDNYHFILNNGFECIFNPYKEWMVVDGKNQEIPQSIQKELPTAVLQCVNDGFFGYKIVKIEKVIEETSKLYYYISLDSDNVILKINSKGELIGYSDKLE